MSLLIGILAIGAIGCKKKSAQISRCLDSLRYIEILKREWANEEGKTTNDIPLWNDLRPFPERWSNNIPICPNGGSYKLNRVGEVPTCSVGGVGHSLTPP